MDKPTLYAKAYLETLGNTPRLSVSSSLNALRAALINRGETHLLPRVLTKVIHLLESEKETSVISRYPLSEETKKQCVAFLKKNFNDVDEHTIQFETDDTMLGGVLMSHKDFLFDGTITTQLQHIK